MTNYKNISDKYDVAIIGSDLSTLILAQLLHAQHELKTVVISTKQSLQDFRKDINDQSICLDENIQFLPGDSESIDAIQWLYNSVLETDIESQINEANPVTFDGGKFKPFLGFGGRDLKTIDILNYYFNQQEAHLNLSPEEWAQLLIKKFEGDFLPKSFVTQVIVEDGRVESVILNETKKLAADKFVFCGSPKELLELLPSSVLTGKVRQKIAKSPLYTRLNLNIQHGTNFDHQSGIHVLVGTKDDFEPVVGRFAQGPLLIDGGESTDSKVLTSHWTYLLNDENYGEPEAIGAAVKYMKRQIKRAYPESFDGENQETIAVYRDSHGHVDLDSIQLKGLNNFFIASSQTRSTESYISRIQSAKCCYEGFFSSTTPE